MLDQIKIKNIKEIMLCLVACRCATKAKIAEDTQLSTSTVSSCINSLLKIKLLVTDGMEDSSGGRRSTIYRLNRSYGCYVGLVLSATAIEGAVVDCETNVLEHISRPVEEKTFLIHAITEVLGKVISEHSNVLGIGIGVSAELDYKEQIVISAPELGWQFVHLKEIIERQYMIFAYIDHPVNAAAIYEEMTGKAHGQKNYLYVGENSTGKTALVLDGHLCRGVGNSAGKLTGENLKKAVCPDALQFLGVSQLLVNYKSKEFKDQIDTYAKGFTGKLVYVEQTENTYPTAMAAVAQRKWFESIYFML